MKTLELYPRRGPLGGAHRVCTPTTHAIERCPIAFASGGGGPRRTRHDERQRRAGDRADNPDLLQRLHSGRHRDHENDGRSGFDNLGPVRTGLFVGTAAREGFRTNDCAQSQNRGKLTITVEEPLSEGWGSTGLARCTRHLSYEPLNRTNIHICITDIFRHIDGRRQHINHHESVVPTSIPPVAEPLPSDR